MRNQTGAKLWNGAGMTVAALACVLSALPARAQIVGMAISVKGSPQVIDVESSRRLKLQDRVRIGDKIRAVANSQAVVVLFDGGKKFLVAGGKTGVVSRGTVTGARVLPALSGVSSTVANALIGAPTGSTLSRSNEVDLGPLPLNDGFSGWMEEGARNFVWQAAPGATEYNFTLLDENSDTLFNIRTTNTSASYPASSPPIALRKPYMWRVVAGGFDATTSTSHLVRKEWGFITWLNAQDSAALKAATGGATIQALSSGDVTTALLAAYAFETKGVYQNTYTILDALSSNRRAVGANDAFLDFYSRMPPLARAIGAYQQQSAIWKFRNK